MLNHVQYNVPVSKRTCCSGREIFKLLKLYQHLSFNTKLVIHPYLFGVLAINRIKNES